MAEAIVLLHGGRDICDCARRNGDKWLVLRCFRMTKVGAMFGNGSSERVGNKELAQFVRHMTKYREILADPALGAVRDRSKSLIGRVTRQEGEARRKRSQICEEFRYIRTDCKSVKAQR